MAIYVYCADSSWDTSQPPSARDLTPRCVIFADDRDDARRQFENIEKRRYPQTRQAGAAGFRKATAREMDRIVDQLPEASDYLDNMNC